MVNVVAEMAVAAGVAAPDVRVIESATVNAVAVGLTVNDATVLVTSGFLERLDRDERQAMIAHLVASVGNGDLEIAATIFSVFETWALVAALLEVPLSARRRALVRQFARLAYDEVGGRADEGETRDVIDSLLAGAGRDSDDFISMMQDMEPKSALGGCRLIFISLPLLAVLGLATIAARESTNLFTGLVLGPWLSAMWRARRRLADATAVQLTRNPEALASAVRTMATCNVEVPGGWPVHFLFPVWVPVTNQPAAEFAGASANVIGMRLDPEPRLRELAALGASMDGQARVRLAARLREALPSWHDLSRFVGWAIVAGLLIAVLMVVTLLAASLLLMLLWWVLRWVRQLVPGSQGPRSSP